MPSLPAQTDSEAKNPTFADTDGDGTPDGWNPYPPGDGASRVLAAAPGGGLVFKDDDKDNGLGLEQWVPVDEGKRYTASAEVTGNGAVTFMMIFAREKPAKAGDLKSVQLADKSSRAEAGKTTEISAIAPAGAKWMKLWLYCPKIGVTDVVIKKVGLKSDIPPAPDAAAAPPASTPAPALVLPTGPIPKGNLLLNPSFAGADGDATPDGWNPYPPGDGTSRVLAAAPGGGLLFKDDDKNNGLGIEQWAPVQEGVNYTATADVTGHGAVSLMMIFAREKPARPGDLKSVQLADKSTRAEAGRTATVSAPAPPGAKWVKIWLYCPKIGVTDVVIHNATLTAAAATPSTSAPAVAAPLPPGLASVLDFETGDLSQAHRGAGEGAYVSVIKKGEGPVREGNFAAKTALSKDKVRAEVPGHRSDAYGIARYGWSMFIPEDFDALTHFSIVAQWHSWGSGRESPKDGGPPTCLIIHKGEMKFKLLHQGDNGWTSEKKEFPLGSMEDMRGKWTDWVLEINWQPPGKGGWLKLYKNDKLVLDHQGTTWYEEKNKGPYFKFGLYKGSGQWKGEEAGAILYFDSGRMALGEDSTYEMVAPSAYSPRPEK